jgi:hypothetical protein
MAHTFHEAICLESYESRPDGSAANAEALAEIVLYEPLVRL